ncbi:macrophage mannose receptor 1-like isoform X2 [Stegastes partitus]|uniref:Macrophage mannose receptor 1-like isoform X2 n=1 Tax=Stegastes partitus TaxID=144197 RepID=A0A9Y4KNF6_9TELE|nr:PREDICTED: macrophage mannose receptor 1-like isoform X2 [Stegastes partitus]
MTESRLIVMNRTLTFIAAFCSVALGSSDFHLINLTKSYDEAKSYCRERDTDLATVHNSTDMNSLITLISNSIETAWIGLEIGEVWMWHWSRPYQKTDFFNWKAGQPQDEQRDTCAAMDQAGKWFDSDCKIKRSFVCHGSGDASKPMYVPQKKSWRNAQSHCRGLSSDLVSIQSAEENTAVHSVSESQDVWIGLFKDPWKWSDGSNSSFRFWRPNQPNYKTDQHCVVALFRVDGKWNDIKCKRKINFICRGAMKLIPITTITQNSTQGSSTPNEESTNSSQGVIVTLHFTVATNNQSNTTNVTTTASTTTTLNTTDSVSHASSTGPNTAATETTTQPPPETTATTSSTPNETSATHSSTPSSHPGLILIQKNMTWIEAMSYCRQHHIDLIHVTTRDIQDKVAEKAKNATTAHVWLGLRYTCNFKFWFWTKSTSGCYQNWVAGEGSDGEYECGVSGAIQATGGQQWVGLNETERLNFICYTCGG